MDEQVQASAGVQMIINMDKSHINDVVKIHIESFPDSFLTNLGAGVLKVIYQEFPESGFGYVFLDDDQVAGFLAGTFIPARNFYRRLVVMKPIKLFLLLVFSLIRSPHNFVPIVNRARSLLKKKSSSNLGSSASEYEEILKNDPMIAHVLTVAVSPNGRRRGIANKLWAFTIHELTEKGVTSIMSSVISDNDPPNRLYEKMGCKKIATLPRVDGKEEFKWLYYRRGECTFTPEGNILWND